MRWPAAESELCEGRRRGVPSEAICVMRRRQQQQQEVRHPPVLDTSATHSETRTQTQARPLLMTLVSRSDVFSRRGWENSSGEVSLERHGARKKHKSSLNFVSLTFWFTLKNISILNEHLPSWFTTHLIKKINVLSYETSRLLAFCLTWLLRIQFRDITCDRP